MNDVVTPAEIEAELPLVVQWAKSLVIVAADDFVEVGERLKQIKGMAQRVTDFFRPLKKAADETKRKILEAERKLASPLAEAEVLAKRAMLMYQDEQRRKANEERACLQAIADEQARREQEALLKKAAKAKKPETKERYAEAAAQVIAPVVSVPSAAAKVDGIATVKVWKFRVDDPAMVPRLYLVVDEKKLGAYARAMREGSIGTVPGVTFYAEESISSRGRSNSYADPGL